MTDSIDPRRAQLRIIFLIVFLYLVGFGVIIPMIPLLARDFGASAFQVGLLMSVYSGVQFIFSPFWGRLSDRKGRKPILLFCLLGEGLSYLLFAFSRSLEMLFLSRILAGFFAGSISTAAAYISDITPPKERSKGMALIGAAFGLGFLIGPALGGFLTTWGQTFSSEKHFGTGFAGIFVSIFCLIIFILGLKYLTESLHLRAKHHIEPALEKRQNRLLVLFKYVGRPLLGPMIIVYLLSSFAMSTMEATLILFLGDRYQWGIREVSYGFAYVGLISVFCQGYLVRKLLPVVGERRMMVFGLLVLGLSIAAIPFVPSLAGLAVVMTCLGVGNSFTNPSVLGSISLLSGAEEQGLVLGIAQSAASLGRILGPALGGILYQHFTQSSPFLSGGFIALLGFLITTFLFAQLPETAKKQSAGAGA